MSRRFGHLQNEKKKSVTSLTEGNQQQTLKSPQKNNKTGDRLQLKEQCLAWTFQRTTCQKAWGTAAVQRCTRNLFHSLGGGLPDWASFGQRNTLSPVAFLVRVKSTPLNCCLLEGHVKWELFTCWFFCPAIVPKSSPHVRRQEIDMRNGTGDLQQPILTVVQWTCQSKSIATAKQFPLQVNVHSHALLTQFAMCWCVLMHFYLFQ